MKTFMQPECEVVLFEKVDVVTGSLCENGETPIDECFCEEPQNP